MSTEQLLRDPNITPTSEVIANHLGSANSAYTKLIAELADRDIHVDWRYYNDGKAWLGKALHQWTTSRGTSKEVTVAWLSIHDGYFKVTVYIPEKARADASILPLSDEMRETIETTQPTGKLKFFPITFDLRSDEGLEELLILMDFRKMLK